MTDIVERLREEAYLNQIASLEQERDKLFENNGWCASEIARLEQERDAFREALEKASNEAERGKRYAVEGKEGETYGALLEIISIAHYALKDKP